MTFKQGQVGELANRLVGMIIPTTQEFNLITNAVTVDNVTNVTAGRAMTYVANKEAAAVAGGTGSFAGVVASVDRNGIMNDEYHTRTEGDLNQQITVYSAGCSIVVQLVDADTGLVSDTAATVGMKVGYRAADGKFFAAALDFSFTASAIGVTDELGNPRAFVVGKPNANGEAVVRFK